METEKSTENVWKAEQKNKENVENQAYQISQERALEMLEELLEQDQFELLLPEYKLVYMMNDAVESFLVFHGARMTGILHTDRTETGNVRTVPATQLLLLPGSAGSIYCTKRESVAAVRRGNHSHGRIRRRSRR